MATAGRRSHIVATLAASAHLPALPNDGIAGEALLQAEVNRLLLLLGGEPAAALGRVRHRWTVWRSWRDPS